MKRTLLLLLLTACATTQTATPAPEKPAVVEAPKAPPSAPVPYQALPAVEPMKVVVLRKPNTPIVSLRLVFRAGSVDDPPGKEGLTALTTRVLLEGGTRSLDSAQLLAALYPMAAELDADTDKEFTTIEGRVHQERLARFLELFTETLLAPRLDAKEFERLRSEQLDFVTKRLRQENDEELSKAALDALLYAGHPYRHPTAGTEGGLAAITLDDVKAQWKAVFSQDRLIIGLAGAVDEALGQQLQATLSALPKTGVTRAPLPTAPGPMGQTQIIQRDTMSTAGDFGFSTLVRRDSPDFVPLFIAMSYFGEHRQEHGVLFNELRDKRGLNYGTYAYAQHYRQVGWSSTPRLNILRSQQDVTFWLRPVQPANAVFATRGVVYFLEELRTKPLPRDRFETARGFLAGATRIWSLTDQQKLGWAIDDLLGGTQDFLGTVRARLETITPDEVQAAVRKHVDPARINFVFVTRDARSLADALGSGAASPISYASPKDAALLEVDQAISRVPLPLDPKRIEIMPADQFMRR